MDITDKKITRRLGSNRRVFDEKINPQKEVAGDATCTTKWSNYQKYENLRTKRIGTVGLVRLSFQAIIYRLTPLQNVSIWRDVLAKRLPN